MAGVKPEGHERLALEPMKFAKEELKRRRKARVLIRCFKVKSTREGSILKIIGSFRPWLVFRILVISVLLLSLPSLLFAQIQPLTVGYSAVTGTQAILHVVREAGIFKKHGLEVRPVLISGSPKAAMALIAGDVKMVFTAAAGTVAPIARGADIVIVAGIVNMLDFSFFVLPGIKSPMDLKGQTIAITSFGDTSDFLSRYLLARWGLSPDRDVTLLQIGPQPERFAALQTGRVKGTLLQVPNTVIARKMGFTELVRPEDFNLDYQGTVVASTRSYLRTHPEIAKLFMKALVEGIYYYKKNRLGSVNSISKFLRLKDTQLAEEAYHFYSKVVSPIPYPTLKGIETILEERGKRDPVVAKLKAESLMETGILHEIEREGFVDKMYGEKVR
jgi:NitT/TauT family transport system substrate-binding protein